MDLVAVSRYYGVYITKIFQTNFFKFQVPKLLNGASGCPSMPCDETRGLQCLSGTCQCSSVNFYNGSLCGNWFFWYAWLLSYYQR